MGKYDTLHCLFDSAGHRASEKKFVFNREGVDLRSASLTEVRLYRVLVYRPTIPLFATHCLGVASTCWAKPFRKFAMPYVFDFLLPRESRAWLPLRFQQLCPTLKVRCTKLILLPTTVFPWLPHLRKIMLRRFLNMSTRSLRTTPTAIGQYLLIKTLSAQFGLLPRRTQPMFLPIMMLRYGLWLLRMTLPPQFNLGFPSKDQV